jgi:hypothetical protein
MKTGIAPMTTLDSLDFDRATCLFLLLKNGGWRGVIRVYEPAHPTWQNSAR